MLIQNKNLSSNRTIINKMQLSTMINGLATTKSHTPATMSKNNNQLLCPSAISPNGSYYSVSTHDGQLHIWDTKTSALVADYTPTAHLSATCVRLVWPSPSTNRSSIRSNVSNSCSNSFTSFFLQFYNLK